jgi:hypothetical protein
MEMLVNNQQLVLIDHSVGHKFEGDRFHNEMGTLHTLYGGLSFLNAQMSGLEKVARNSKNGNTITGFFADLESSFDLPSGSNVLIPCFYHWFGVSIVNFVRKVGLLDGIAKGEVGQPPYNSRQERRDVSQYCTAYVRDVVEIAEAYVWRNKVFAHFASTDPYDGDNEALFQQVSFYPVSYSQGRLEVGGFQVFTGSFDPLNGPGPDPSSGSGLPSWALTEVFENFSSRYTFEVAPSNIGR